MDKQAIAGEESLRMFRTLALMVLVFTWQSGQACSCVPTPAVDEAFRVSDSVFDGTVVAVEDRQVGWRKALIWFRERFGYFNHSPADIGLGIRFRVHESWKGQGSSERFLFTHKSSPTCGYPVRLGERYLVYTYELEAGVHEISLCSRTRERATGEEDAIALRIISKSRKF